MHKISVFYLSGKIIFYDSQIRHVCNYLASSTQSLQISIHTECYYYYNLLLLLLLLLLLSW